MFLQIKKVINLFRLVLSANKLHRSHTEAEQFLARQAIVRTLADAKGLTMKIGQLFADVEGTSVYQELVEGIEPFPLKQMITVLEQDLGMPVNKVFKSIDESVSAASLGQVHFGILLTGEKVAIKIRYPDIQKAVETELRIAGLLPGIGPVKQWGFNLEAYKTNLRNNMLRELDYLSEAKRQHYFAQAVCVQGLNIPCVYMDYCSQRVLVQSRASGVMINEISDWPKPERVEIGRILLSTLFNSLFVAGEVHGDPHPGNVFFAHNDTGHPIVNLLDFGCTIPISEQRRLALLKLIVSCRLRNKTSPMDCFVALGFDADKLFHIYGALPVLCQYLFKPFISNQTLNLANWDIEKNLTDLLADKRWWFRSAGPADLFLILRAFQGLVVQLKYIQVNLNWWEILQQTVGESLIQQSLDYDLPTITVPKPINNARFFDQAKKLCVQVNENGKTIVSVTLPADAALDLEQIMPEHVTQLLQKNESIDFNKIVQGLRNNGLQPQLLFDFENGYKHYKVWLD